MLFSPGWRWILERLLRWTGNQSLLPFLEGMRHLGRPSEFFLPPELVGQGLSVFLSGLNNTMAVQSNPDWIWPYWVERQSDPDSPEFQPTALNVIKGNLTHRNWTSLGLPDSTREFMLDPVGMLTLRPFGWSVFPYLRWEGEVFCPPRMEGRVRQSLLADGPGVATEYRAVPGLEWRSEAMALGVEEEELAGFNHFLKNQSPRTLALVFGLALRPYNPLTIGHINRLRYKNRLWRVNRRPGLLLFREPDQVILSDRHRGDPLSREIAPTSSAFLESRSGIATGVAEFQMRLEPNASWSLETAGMVGRRRPAPNAKFRHVTEPALKAARARQGEHWEAQRRAGLRLRLPDPGLQAAYEAVKSHLAVFDDGDHFSPGTFFYHHPWIRDGAFLALANEQVGFPQRVASKIQGLLRCQDGTGYFKSQRGEWDSNGQALFTLVHHLRLGGDPALLEPHFHKLMEGVRWIEKMRGENRKSPSPHFGLLPAGFSAEHFGPNDHYYWDNFWSLAGMHGVLWAARLFGKDREIRWLRERCGEYRQDLESSFQSCFDRLGARALPCSPYRRMDSAAIGNLVAVSPLDLVSEREEWVRATTAFLVRNNLRDGLFFQKIIHTGLNPYLSAQLARVLFRQGDPLGHSVLQALLRRASPTYTWPEAMHPRTYGGCMGDGDHGWAAAEFLSLVREMALETAEDEIRLAPHLPADWLRPGLDLSVEGAPSVHGTVHYALRYQAGGLDVEWSVTRSPHQDPGTPCLALPDGWASHSGCDVRGEGARRRMVLPGDAGRIRLEAPSHATPGAAKIPAAAPSLSTQDTP